MSFFDALRNPAMPNSERLRKLDHCLDLIEQMAVNQLTMWAQQTRMEIGMADWSNFDENLRTLIEGYRAAIAKNAVYEEQLKDTNKAVQDAVEKALAEDDAVDQEKIDAADNIIVDGLNRPADTVEDSSPDVTTPPEAGTDPGLAVPGADTPPESQDPSPGGDSPTDGGVPAGNA